MSECCGICGSRASVPWRDCGDWHYVACAGCTAIRLDPPPADNWAESFYDRGYFAGSGRGGYADYLADEMQHRNNARSRIELARRHGVAPPAGWLDVGCATGFTLDEARAAGFTVRGVELSDWARGIASGRFGLNVVATLDEARRALPLGSDVVSFFQVLEHLRDPLAALRSARACLRPGGLLLLETWDRNSLVARLLGRYWHQITPPSVLWLFDRRSLALALERAGFQLRTIVCGAKQISVGWALGLLAEKSPRLLAPALRLLARSGLHQWNIPYNLGDLVFVVAVAADPRDAPR